jgi:hypothetical protein
VPVEEPSTASGADISPQAPGDGAMSSMIAILAQDD